MAEVILTSAEGVHLPTGGMADVSLPQSDSPIDPSLQDTALLERACADLRRAKATAEAANEAKSRYLVAVSHEIRSPLNAIYGYAQLLERGDAVSSTEAGAVIRRSAEHLSNLVEGLLEISRLEGGVLKICSDVVHIHALFEQVVDMFRIQAQSKGLYLRLTTDRRLPRLVRTDEKRLRQILINLVSNAVKYTRQGGVEIIVGYRNHVADVNVIDTGIGIDTIDIERIFEPFERAASPEVQGQPGIGLGLAITRALSRMMGGDIVASSTIGAGSSFRLRLMLAPAQAAVDVAPTDRRIGGYRGARRTVLVIDDDPEQSAVLQALLRPLGFVVYAAGSGSEGITLAARCTPDLILLDIQMPGISGWETKERLQSAHGSDLKIVMVSANVEDLRATGDDGASQNPFIAKPFDFATLLTVIGTQLQLTWDSTSAEPGSEETFASGPLPIEARAFFEQIRYLAGIGHVAGIECQLADFEREIPSANRLVSELRSHLNNFDLGSLLERVGHAERG